VWWTLLKVPGRLGFIRDIREVRFALAAGIFSKIHHVGGVGVLIAAQGKTFRVIRVVRGQPGLVGRK
jgi:hypothetical protein